MSEFNASRLQLTVGFLSEKPNSKPIFFQAMNQLSKVSTTKRKSSFGSEIPLRAEATTDSEVSSSSKVPKSKSTLMTTHHQESSPAPTTRLVTNSAPIAESAFASVSSFASASKSSAFLPDAASPLVTSIPRFGQLRAHLLSAPSSSSGVGAPAASSSSQSATSFADTQTSAKQWLGDHRAIKDKVRSMSAEDKEAEFQIRLDELRVAQQIFSTALTEYFSAVSTDSALQYFNFDTLPRQIVHTSQTVLQLVNLGSSLDDYFKHNAENAIHGSCMTVAELARQHAAISSLASPSGQEQTFQAMVAKLRELYSLCNRMTERLFQLALVISDKQIGDLLLHEKGMKNFEYGQAAVGPRTELSLFTHAPDVLDKQVSKVLIAIGMMGAIHVCKSSKVTVKKQQKESAYYNFLDTMMNALCAFSPDHFVLPERFLKNVPVTDNTSRNHSMVGKRGGKHRLISILEVDKDEFKWDAPAGDASSDAACREAFLSGRDTPQQNCAGQILKGCAISIYNGFDVACARSTSGAPSTVPRLSPPPAQSPRSTSPAQTLPSQHSVQHSTVARMAYANAISNVSESERFKLESGAVSATSPRSSATSSSSSGFSSQCCLHPDVLKLMDRPGFVTNRAFKMPSLDTFEPSPAHPFASLMISGADSVALLVGSMIPNNPFASESTTNFTRCILASFGVYPAAGPAELFTLPPQVDEASVLDMMIQSGYPFDVTSGLQLVADFIASMASKDINETTYICCSQDIAKLTSGESTSSSSTPFAKLGMLPLTSWLHPSKCTVLGAGAFSVVLQPPQSFLNVNEIGPCVVKISTRDEIDSELHMHRLLDHLITQENNVPLRRLVYAHKFQLMVTDDADQLHPYQLIVPGLAEVPILLEALVLESCGEAITLATRLTDADVREFFQCMKRSLAFMHLHGIVHRDMKPTNATMITSSSSSFSSSSSSSAVRGAPRRFGDQTKPYPKFLLNDVALSKCITDCKAGGTAGTSIFQIARSGARPYGKVDDHGSLDLSCIHLAGLCDMNALQAQLTVDQVIGILNSANAAHKFGTTLQKEMLSHMEAYKADEAKFSSSSSSPRDREPRPSSPALASTAAASGDVSASAAAAASAAASCESHQQQASASRGGRGGRGRVGARGQGGGQQK